ncbi:putative PTS system, sucrose-specific IIABC component [Selenomonas ruminantium subsp. lactilytica TAM6421]|uniref:Putative PTS system, sucrose-specific IIABC component n=1 Tax=Selenomonas ruminantium subsp. lactilytica (strain NBRC 103574 / TAM6421) TaxID=927704 RepID=I0GLT4_SELRL|nr:glucose PTS transporter subunit IIA [Selenomonas ruminantium]BAL81721.1 putative PTS system, sucrose-specific IIABC component [Selenomonas ruminantium subsp. lactilytica TAM6421]
MKEIRLDSPLNGELVELSQVNDPAFASGAMGFGAAVKNPEGKVYAPVDGEITVLFETKHAIGIHGVNGEDLLIHVGLDTVKLNGEHFTAHVEQGAQVKKGQLLLEFDAEAIKAAGYDVTTPFVVTNSSEFEKITIALGDKEIVCAQAEEKAAAVTSDDEYADLPKEARVAKLIEKYVGGMDNVRNAEHCATRLRLIINDKSKIDEKAIENIDGVKGQFFAAAQYQIILGTGFVDKVFAEFVKGTNFSGVSNKEEAYAQMTPLQKISRTLGDVFVPIIPVLVATGLFMGLRGAAQSLGVQFSPNVLLLSQILTDTAFIFLPALVCWSTMKRFGGTPVIGLVLGLMLVGPQLPNAWAVAGGDVKPIPMEVFGMTIGIVGYQGSVLPALVLGIFAAKLQKALKSIVPDIIDLIVTPFVTLFISMILGILIIGPIMHSLETTIFGAVSAFLQMPMGIGGFIVGGLQQVIVVFGVHHVFNALEVQLLATTGVDPFNAIITGAIVAQGGAAVAVAMKTEDKKKRALYISSAVPAFLGITEPAIFGINLRFMKPFLYALVGGACAGGVASFLHLAGTGMGITVLPGTLLYLDHLLEYIIVNLIGFGVAFALTFTLFKPEE